MTQGDLLDPFAGVGQSLPEFECPGRTIVGVEIEPEWAACSPYIISGDSTKLDPTWTDRFNMLVTSCVYGNRFSDHHNASDPSIRRSYTHDLRSMTGNNQRKLATNNTGQYSFFNMNYKLLHEKAWPEITRVSAPGCLGLFNFSDFIKDDDWIGVTAWHLNLLCSLGWQLHAMDKIETPRFRHGANNKKRVPFEWLATMRLPA